VRVVGVLVFSRLVERRIVKRKLLVLVAVARTRNVVRFVLRHAGGEGW
jgi:hypothetical protein